MVEWEYIECGPAPADEECAQRGHTPGFLEVNKRECRGFIEAIRRTVGPEPDGAELVVRCQSQRDPYYEVATKYDPNNSLAVEYAFKAANEAPTTWEQAGLTGEEVRRNAWKSKFNGVQR